MFLCIFVSDRLRTPPAFESDFVEHVHHKPVDFNLYVVRSAIGTLFFCFSPGGDALGAVELVALATLLWVYDNLGADLADEQVIKGVVNALLRV